MYRLLLLAFVIPFAGCQKAEGISQQSPLQLVDTGQSQAFSSQGEALNSTQGTVFEGQDSDYQGAPFSFVVDTEKQTVFDLNTGITWQRTASEQGFSWKGANNYCSQLDLAGHTDWRLPSLKELISIEDFSDGWPYLDTQIFSIGDQPIGKHLQYWSNNFYHVGTTHGGAPTAFGINYGTGHIKGYPTGEHQGPSDQTRRPPPPPPPQAHNGDQSQANSARPPRRNPAHKLVRCVYGDAYGTNQFVDNGDGTVSDLATGLMWMKQDSGKGLDWQHALSYAEGLEFAGYSDWKLPNVKELQSIVDYSGVYPAIDPKFFSITDKDAYFWSSTSAYFAKSADKQQAQYHWAWYVAFGYAVGPDGKDSHGAGAIRFDAKSESGPKRDGGERIFNYARAVRLIN